MAMKQEKSNAIGLQRTREKDGQKIPYLTAKQLTLCLFPLEVYITYLPALLVHRYMLCDILYAVPHQTVSFRTTPLHLVHPGEVARLRAQLTAEGRRHTQCPT